MPTRIMTITMFLIAMRRALAGATPAPTAATPGPIASVIMVKQMSWGWTCWMLDLCLLLAFGFLGFLANGCLMMA